jgi:ribonucleoside-diphosphate reductase alpha chain
MTKATWLNKDSRTFLSRGYLREGQEAEERIREIAEAAERILGKKFKGFADKFEEYMLRGWISLSSPVWSNFGNDRGLPISCNNVWIDDTIDDIIYKNMEVGAQTKNGAGTSGFFGELRPRNAPISAGGFTSGPVHFMEMFETTINIISQSNIRRGNFAAYLPVEHLDIMEFLEAREEGHPIQKLSLGVCVTDAWMNSMLAGDKDKRKIWMRILKKRFETGYPYIFYTDTVNNNAPDVYKDKGMKIHSSNLCSEITQPSSLNESFVCCLASIPILGYEEWKETDLVETLTYFLDAVMSDYIEKIKNKPNMATSYNFAVNHRALGIGTLGWHSYLQSKSIPFESSEAEDLNIEVHKFISEKSLKASQHMANIIGEPPLMKGYGRRNATLMAIAPTTSSSFILGQISPSIEPLNSNYFTKDLAKGKFTYKNPYLERVLEEKYDKNSQEVWHSILLKGGSVQHLEFMDEHDKNVFKTFGEITQMNIIIQAADRQKYIDQSQSLNLMIHPNTPVKDVSQLLIEAWKLGVKTLYYQRSTNPAQELARNLTKCEACEV